MDGWHDIYDLIDVLVYVARLDKMAQQMQPLHHYMAKLQFEHKRYTDIYNLLVMISSLLSDYCASSLSSSLSCIYVCTD